MTHLRAIIRWYTGWQVGDGFIFTTGIFVLALVGAVLLSLWITRDVEE